MEPPGENLDRLLKVLEEVRVLLAGSVPPSPAPQKKKLSWEDVWQKASYGVRPTTTTAASTQSGLRLSEQYTRALRALRHSSR
jgi:hypothetical protein